ncbi:MAG TPA: hypothetical protein VN253_01415 [Kofleriaceae bacterium]|nr:hypothetical protein [Kofleriaceae bacterium]
MIVPIRAFVHATELCPRRGTGQDLVRLPSGELPDDVSVVLCRELDPDPSPDV